MLRFGNRALPGACVVALGLFAVTAAVNAQAPKQDAKANAAKSTPAAPVEGGQLREDINETIVRRSIKLTLPGGKAHTGEFVTHFRPAGEGPFPVVIMNHGRGTAEERAKLPRQRYTLVAGYWTRRGFAVLVPTRVGYGEVAQGVDPERSVGTCATADYRQMMANVVAHIRASLEFAREQPWADVRKVIVMGTSVGGLGAIGASASELPGMITAINFVGGSGGSPTQRPENPCNSDGIGQRVLEAGKAARVPMLWLYAENDRFWGSKLPRQWHAAYTNGGGKAELIMFPPVGDDGHKLLAAGFTLWRRALDGYVARFGIAAPKSPGTHRDSGYAKIDDVERLPLRTATAQEGYMKFLNADVPRAFAVAPSGAWEWRFGAGTAAETALRQCSQRAKQACKLYAVDDMVVWTP